MLSKIKSYGLSGLNVFPVSVETDVSTYSQSFYEVVGLPDAAVRESRERVRAAIQNSGYEFPKERVVVSLAPADMRKEGSVYDLPSAVGVLLASGQLSRTAELTANEFVFLGELALDGTLRAVSGILPMLIGACENGVKNAIVPFENAPEAAAIEGMNVYGMASLKQTAEFILGKLEIAPITKRKWTAENLVYSQDFSEIKGQHGAKRAAEIAAAGGHNLLLVGTPGSGKTMLARCIPTVLPALTYQEALEITKIHSVVGALKGVAGMVNERPFRAPHHNASAVSLIGGGQKAMPGEVSLAHYGVLFLDEFPEFRKDVLEALRQPLEDGEVTISRAMARSTYPADFMLIAAMNPCPCGNYGSKVNQCRCTPTQVMRYRNRISGPMLDRIDMHIEMTEVGYDDISSTHKSESSANIRERVNTARKIQQERYINEGIIFNAQLSGAQIKKYCKLDTAAETLLKKAFVSLKLSARAYTRVLKVARTIADLDASKTIAANHVAEAVQYRSLESKYWGEA